MLRLAYFCNDLVDELNQGLVYVMGFVDCIDHDSFRNFVCTGLDHDNLFACGSDSQLQIALFPLFLRRVDNKLPVDHANLCHCAGTGKRNIGNAGCNRRTDHCHQLRTALGIYGQNQVI